MENRWGHVQGLEFVKDSLMVPIWGYGMILGIQWLVILDSIRWNVNALARQFRHQGEMVWLKGIPPNTCAARMISVNRAFNYAIPLLVTGGVQQEA